MKGLVLARCVAAATAALVVALVASVSAEEAERFAGNALVTIRLAEGVRVEGWGAPPLDVRTRRVLRCGRPAELAPEAWSVVQGAAHRRLGPEGAALHVRTSPDGARLRFRLPAGPACPVSIELGIDGLAMAEPDATGVTLTDESGRGRARLETVPGDEGRAHLEAARGGVVSVAVQAPSGSATVELRIVPEIEVAPPVVPDVRDGLFGRPVELGGSHWALEGGTSGEEGRIQLIDLARGRRVQLRPAGLRMGLRQARPALAVLGDRLLAAWCDPMNAWTHAELKVVRVDPRTLAIERKTLGPCAERAPVRLVALRGHHLVIWGSDSSEVLARRYHDFGETSDRNPIVLRDVRHQGMAASTTRDGFLVVGFGAPTTGKPVLVSQLLPLTGEPSPPVMLDLEEDAAIGNLAVATRRDRAVVVYLGQKPRELRALRVDLVRRRWDQTTAVRRSLDLGFGANAWGGLQLAWGSGGLRLVWEGWTALIDPEDLSVRVPRAPLELQWRGFAPSGDGWVGVAGDVRRHSVRVTLDEAGYPTEVVPVPREPVAWGASALAAAGDRWLVAHGPVGRDFTVLTPFDHRGNPLHAPAPVLEPSDRVKVLGAGDTWLVHTGEEIVEMMDRDGRTRGRFQTVQLLPGLSVPWDAMHESARTIACGLDDEGRLECRDERTRITVAADVGHALVPIDAAPFPGGVLVLAFRDRHGRQTAVLRPILADPE